MGKSIRVNLHSHSTFSDGSISPERVVEAMAGAGVRAAALTDHDTTAGLERFAQAAHRHGIDVVSGTEITVEGIDGLHLLAYGFDPENRELQEMLLAHRRHRADRRGDPIHALWRLGVWIASLVSRSKGDPLHNALPDAAEAIRIVHRAGGTVFLAHPHTLSTEIERLDHFAGELKSAGLDGIEVIYAQYDEPFRGQLLGLAAKHGLLVSAGTDFHGFDRPDLNQTGIDCAEDLWRSFCLANKLPLSDPATGEEVPARPALRPGLLRRRTMMPAGHKFAWKRFALRIVFPTVLAMGLFVLAIFGVIVPFFESSLLERKREMIRELTNSAWSILAESEEEARAGRLTLNQAKEKARGRFELLRYGKERKDYFWITDLHPRMVMHPYRRDLVGTDLSDFADVRGRKLFVESVKVVGRQGEGFVQYYWQWKDNPDRLAPKESFVRRFEPWDWIIGTGIYLDDVHAEIAKLTNKLTAWCLGISAVIVLLLTWIASQSLRIERRRAQAEVELRESHEKYAALVEAATEGTLMVLDGRCAYANRTMCEMLGFTESELSQMQAADLFLAGQETSERAIENVGAMMRGESEPAPFEAQLAIKGGGAIDAVIALTRVALAGKSGFILVARDVSRSQTTMRRAGDPRQDALIEELRMSLLFLNEPLRQWIRPLRRCDTGAPIHRAAELMSRDPSGALAVTSGTEDAVIGIVTDHDLRQRVLLAGLETSRPVGEVMTSPVLALADSAPVYEALVAMHEHKISHLGIRDEQGKIVSLVRAADLIQFHQYSSSVITGTIQKARNADDVAEIRARLPRLVKALLDCGARPRNILHITTHLSDAIVQRLIELAIREAGPAPGRFCFLALGSEGRGEQTLLTDQDNAIIYEDPPADQAERFERYFLALGEKVCGWLDQAGYRFCRGKVMARHAPWRRTLSAWKKQALAWITAAGPQDLFDFNVFFDFRPVAGDGELAAELRSSIRVAMSEDPPFFLHMARHAISYKPPLSFFGNIAGGSSTFNIKDAAMPIVTFARLYGLRHGVDQTSTFDRLDRLEELGILKTAFHDEVVQAYTFLMRMRLEHQAQAMSEGRECDNQIAPRGLTHMDGSMLKQSFSIISTIQKKISYDFLGVA